MSYGFKVWIWFRDGSVEVFRNVVSVCADGGDMTLTSCFHDTQPSYPANHIGKLEVFPETEFAEVFSTLPEEVL